MKNIFIIAAFLINFTALSGEGESGGGPRMTAKSVSVPKNLISDIRLKDGSVVPFKEVIGIKNTSSSVQETSTAIKFGFSKKSPIADIQLVSGDIIDLTILTGGDGDSGGN